MTTQNFVGTLVVVHCYKCGTPFGIDERLHRDRKEKGENFCCPNGHAQAYVKSEIQKLKEEVASAQRDAQFYREDSQYYQNSLRSTERRLSAQKAATTRVKKRASNGVCLYCSRTFVALTKHVETKHPEKLQEFQSQHRHDP